MFDILLRRLIRWIDAARHPPTPGGMYIFWKGNGSMFTGHVLLPPFAGAEIGDSIPKRRLLVVKDADASVVLDDTFDSAVTEKTFGPVNEGDALTLSLWDIDQAGNPSTTPAVANAVVTDTTPPATPGQMMINFQQDSV